MKPYMVLPKRLMRGIKVVIMMDRKLYVSSLICRRIMRAHIFKTLSHNKRVLCLIFFSLVLPLFIIFLNYYLRILINNFFCCQLPWTIDGKHFLGLLTLGNYLLNV